MTEPPNVPRADEAALANLATAIVDGLRLYLHPEAKHVAYVEILDALGEAERQGYERGWGVLWPLVQSGEELRNRDMLHAITAIVRHAGGSGVD